MLISLYINDIAPYIPNTFDKIIRESFNYSGLNTDYHIYWIVVLTLSLGVLAGHTLNILSIPLKGRRFFFQQAINNDDFEKLILKSVEEVAPLLLTMSNGKIYIGYAIRGLDPGPKGNYLRILPLISGYRDQEHREVHFTTRYEEIYDQIPSSQYKKFEMVLPVSEIQSSTLFDDVIYQQFQSQQNKK